MPRVQGARRAALTGGGESVALGGDVLAETALLGQAELVQQLTATGTNELVQHWAKEKQWQSEQALMLTRMLVHTCTAIFPITRIFYCVVNIHEYLYMAAWVNVYTVIWFYFVLY